VGVDTRWPSEARNAEELQAATAPYDWWSDKQYVSGAKFLDLLDNQVSPNAVRLLRHLAMNLAGRNHWFGKMADLERAIGLPTRTLERALQELSSINVVRRRNNGRAWPTRLSVHPWYAWKGDLLGRDDAYAEWLDIRPAIVGGQ